MEAKIDERKSGIVACAEIPQMGMWDFSS